MRILCFALLCITLCLALPCTAAEPGAGKMRRKELDALDKETRYKTLLVRHDLREASPSPGRLTELLDGSYYENADPSVAYEELAPVQVLRSSLRQEGRLLLLTVAPPSNILPPHLRTGSAPDVGLPLLVEVDVEAAGSVRAAFASVVYLPGEEPDADAVARCIARYPDHDEARSRMRCGLGREKAR